MTSESPNTSNLNNTTPVENKHMRDNETTDEPMEESYNPTASPVMSPISQNFLPQPGVSELGNEAGGPKTSRKHSSSIRIRSQLDQKTKDKLKQNRNTLFRKIREYRKLECFQNSISEMKTKETNKILDEQTYQILNGPPGIITVRVTKPSSSTTGERAEMNLAETSNNAEISLVGDSSGMNLAQTSSIPTTDENNTINELTQAMEKLNE